MSLLKPENNIIAAVGCITKYVKTETSFNFGKKTPEMNGKQAISRPFA